MITFGVDIGKFRHQAIAVDSNGQPLCSSFSFENTEEGFKLFLQQINHFQKQDALCVGMEATGHYWLKGYNESLEALKKKSSLFWAIEDGKEFVFWCICLCVFVLTAQNGFETFFIALPSIVWKIAYFACLAPFLVSLLVHVVLKIKRRY